MDVCFGQKVYKEKLVLDDRSTMRYPMVVGLHLIGKLGFVDASQAFTVEPHCAEQVSAFPEYKAKPNLTVL